MKKTTYSLGDFVRAVFAQANHSPSLQDTKLLTYALEDLFFFVEAEILPLCLQGRYTSMEAVGADGSLTDFARALMHIGGNDAGLVSYRRFYIPSVSQEGAPVFSWKNGVEREFRSSLEQLADQTDTAFVTDVRLRELFSEDVRAKMLREDMQGVPEELRASMEDSLAQIVLKCRVHSQSCWYVRASKERAWLVDTYIAFLKKGPIAHSALPHVPEWEYVTKRVGVMLSWLLYYFVGLVSDGYANERLTRELAEVLRHFHKHPVLGITKKEKNEWSMLVS